MMENDADVPDEPDVVDVVEDELGQADAKSDALAASADSLSRRDPLAVYMRDVQRYPLLSKDEEHDLAVRFFEEDDLEAAKRLVTSNLRLVVKIAYDYRQAYKNILDLVQEGNIGLMQAVKKYDPYKGVKLSSYAAWWISAYILRYILNKLLLYFRYQRIEKFPILFSQSSVRRSNVLEFPALKDFQIDADLFKELFETDKFH